MYVSMPSYQELFLHNRPSTESGISFCSLEIMRDHVSLQSGVEKGCVNRVNWVAFCPGQTGLTCFIKYPGLTWIL